MKTLCIAAAALSLSAFAPAVFAQANAAPIVAPAPAQRAPAKAHMMNRVDGVVSTVAGSTITVTNRRDPNPVTFTLAPDVKIWVTGPSALTNIALQSPVRVNGKVSADGTSVDARQITLLAALPKVRKNANPARPNNRQVTGTVTSLSPLQVTVGSNPAVVVTVNTQTDTRVDQITAGTTAAIVPTTHISAELRGPATAKVAHVVLVLPAFQPPTKRKKGL